MAKPRPISRHRPTIAVVADGMIARCLSRGLSVRGLHHEVFDFENVTEDNTSHMIGPSGMLALDTIDPLLMNDLLDQGVVDDGCRSNCITLRRGIRTESPHHPFGSPILDLEAYESSYRGHCCIDPSRFRATQAHGEPDVVQLSQCKVIRIVYSDAGRPTLVLNDNGVEVQRIFDFVIRCDSQTYFDKRYILQEMCALHTSDHPPPIYNYHATIPIERAVDILGTDVGCATNVFLGHEGLVLTQPIDRLENVAVSAVRLTKLGESTIDDKGTVNDILWDFDGWELQLRELLSACTQDQDRHIQKLDATACHLSQVCLVGSLSTTAGPLDCAQGLRDAAFLCKMLEYCNDKRVDLRVSSTANTLASLYDQYRTRTALEMHELLSFLTSHAEELTEGLEPGLTSRRRYCITASGLLHDIEEGRNKIESWLSSI